MKKRFIIIIIKVITVIKVRDKRKVFQAKLQWVTKPTAFWLDNLITATKDKLEKVH